MKHLLVTTIAALVLLGCGFDVNKPLVVSVDSVAGAKAPDISIHQAAFNENFAAVKQHIAAGTDVNAKDTYGSTPLTSAVIGGRKEIVEILIDKGADVNGKDHIEWSPLSHAVVEGHKEIVELLIAKGADVNLFNTINLVNTKMLDITALDHAEIVNEKDIADLLRKHGGKTGEELKAEGK